MPIATMIAGPNGSGKSTMIGLLAKAGIDFGEYLNADDIAAANSGPPAEVAVKAQEEVRRKREAALLEGRSHSFETVMSHPSHIDHLRAAKERGFEVIVYFVATNDPVINLGRVANRVSHGGHDVPRDRIVSRYHRSLANLPAAIAIADQGLIFDNSSLGSPMVPIAEIVQSRVREIFASGKAPQWWTKLRSQAQPPLLVIR